jgi:hypothetical protein
MKCHGMAQSLWSRMVIKPSIGYTCRMVPPASTWRARLLEAPDGTIRGTNVSDLSLLTELTRSNHSTSPGANSSATCALWLNSNRSKPSTSAGAPASHSSSRLNRDLRPRPVSISCLRRFRSTLGCAFSARRTSSRISNRLRRPWCRLTCSNRLLGANG